MRRWFVDSYGLTLLSVVLLVVGLCVALLGIVCGGVYVVESRSCGRALDNLHRSGHYDFWGEGCYVNLANGTSIPLANYRLTVTETG